MYDLFFLSHNEANAEAHWQILSASQPHARRISGIDGILAAHRHCASMSRTSHFFVVDADNEVLIDMDFSLKLSVYDKPYVHLWRARNPINDLVYGWGAIKLFPKKLLLDQEVMPLDMTMSFQLKIMPQIGSITHFNTNPFDTWRSAFREGVKLSQNTDQESQERLAVWCKVAHGAHADWCLRGACMGREYGSKQTGAAALKNINDWQWLKSLFEEQI